MGNKITFFDDKLGIFSELPDIHNLDIEIVGPYAQTYDGKQGYFSDLPDIHTLDIETFGPCGQISDG